MNAKYFAGAAIAIAALWASRADASYIIAAPVIVPFEDTEVSVNFATAHAENTGNLYFLGSGSDLGLINAAMNSDHADLGQFLFSNHNPIERARLLEGVFHAGEYLFFAYDVVAPDEAMGDMYRCDLEADRNQFAWETGVHGDSGTLFIEDLHPGEIGYDADYNDLVATITFTPVPSPGSLALIGLGLFVAFSRRRR